jgi:hypothetical protein
VKPRNEEGNSGLLGPTRRAAGVYGKHSLLESSGTGWQEELECLSK